MSRQLLNNLNGSKRGQFKSFLDSFQGDPRIAWYPSAGEDFRALLYLHPAYSGLNPPTAPEPLPPDIFLFTDYYPWQNSAFLDSKNIFTDGRTRVFIEDMEELPRVDLRLHEELVDFPKGSTATGRVMYLKIKIYSDRLGCITYPVLYAFAENETFYCDKLILNTATITHIIHVRYGGGCGGGGNASGIWLLNVLKKLNCELFITDGHHHWQAGDDFALELCKSIPKESTANLIPIRTIKSEAWSGHGDVTWNLVS